ncbi:MAG: hypothetical protein KAI24_10700, partial [Planctomycetes bacterium]|nr:hypothetical protein [Planctomycetota bacterium]
MNTRTTCCSFVLASLWVSALTAQSPLAKAEALIERGRAREAYRVLVQAPVDVRSDEGRAVVLKRGEVAMTLGMTELAVADLSEFVEIESARSKPGADDLATAMFCLAVLCTRLEMYALADSWCRRANKTKPGHAPVVELLDVEWRKMNRVR